MSPFILPIFTKRLEEEISLALDPTFLFLDICSMWLSVLILGLLEMHSRYLSHAYDRDHLLGYFNKTGLSYPDYLTKREEDI